MGVSLGARKFPFDFEAKKLNSRPMPHLTKPTYQEGSTLYQVWTNFPLNNKSNNSNDYSDLQHIFTPIQIQVTLMYCTLYIILAPLLQFSLPILLLTNFLIWLSHFSRHHCSHHKHQSHQVPHTHIFQNWLKYLFTNLSHYIHILTKLVTDNSNIFCFPKLNYVSIEIGNVR